jgi:UDP-2,3-diacylglucosamine pyrophosphatase LpxH
VPGNHDEMFRDHLGRLFGGVRVAAEAIHKTADGRRLLVLHGDEFDAMIKHGFLAALVGAVAYRSLLSLNRFVHWLHEISARPYWSLAQHVKTKIGGAQRYIAAFRNASLRAAEAAGVDGIVCGHIHKAELVERDGLVYCNDGDWVESCTALVERPDGALELLTWRTQAAVAAVGQPLRDAA